MSDYADALALREASSNRLNMEWNPRRGTILNVHQRKELLVMYSSTASRDCVRYRVVRMHVFKW